jgi:1-acyl-sn-glycerol-3-phosphate acyltransferase
LGKDYLTTQNLPKKVSTVVAAPHQCYHDDLILVSSPFFPAFGVKSDAKKIPNLYSILAGLKSFFIERGSDQEARDRIV